MHKIKPGLSVGDFHDEISREHDDVRYFMNNSINTLDNDLIFRETRKRILTHEPIKGEYIY